MANNPISKLQNLPPSLQTFNITLIQYTDPTPGSKTQSRLLVALPYSPILLLIRILSEIPGLTITNRATCLSNQNGSRQNANIVYLANKEVAQEYKDNQRQVLQPADGSTFVAIPAPMNMVGLKPIFLVVEPEAMFGKRKQEGGDLSVFVEEYSNYMKMIATHHASVPDGVIVYESLLAVAHEVIVGLCERWEIPPPPEWLPCTKDLSKEFVFVNTNGDRTDRSLLPNNGSSFSDYLPQAMDVQAEERASLDEEEIIIIQETLCPWYLGCWNN